MSVLNPLMRIAQQIARRRNRRGASPTWRPRRRCAIGSPDFLAEPRPRPSVLDAYPHQLSGGMRQRVLVGLVAAYRRSRGHPRRRADHGARRGGAERRSSNAWCDLQRRLRNTLVIVSHDLGVHYQVADRLAVAYAGRIVEIGPTDARLAPAGASLHRGLVDALPRLGEQAPRLGIEGRPPEPRRPAAGLPVRRRAAAGPSISVPADPDPTLEMRRSDAACLVASHFLMSATAILEVRRPAQGLPPGRRVRPRPADRWPTMSLALRPRRRRKVTGDRRRIGQRQDHARPDDPAALVEPTCGRDLSRWRT